MIDEILNTWQEGQDLVEMKLGPSYKCKYCNKEFRKESTLAAHLCEEKRRWQEEKETGVQFGLQAYLRFYELTQGSAKMKSYGDFVASPYYRAFVKFGRHMVGIRAVNPKMFIDYVIKENKKLDHWCHEKVYLEYLKQYMRKEAVQDALERALKEMQDYADEHGEFKNGFSDYFRFGNPNRVCHHIANGRVSPWIVFNCDTGVDFLDALNDDQIGLILPWIDPEYWQRKFQDYVADTEWMKQILKEANL
jgi:hypothetical protein